MRYLALAIAALLLMAPAAAQKVVGVEIYRSDDTFMATVCRAMEEAAEGRATLDVTDGENRQNVENDAISRHIEGKVDALAVNTVDTAAAPLILEKAEAARIPVVFFNGAPEAADMPERGWYYVGTRAEQSGVMAGELMAAYFADHPAADINGDGMIQCVLLRGRSGDLDAALRTKYCVKAFREAGFKPSLLASECANWQRDEAREIMGYWLASFGDIEAVFANNDDMALGAIDALKAAGYFAGGKRIPVVGVDATEPAIAALREGTLTGTVLNDAENLGRAVVNLSLALASGEAPTEKNVGYPLSDGRYIWIPYKKVTPESLGLSG